MPDNVQEQQRRSGETDYKDPSQPEHSQSVIDALFSDQMASSVISDQGSTQIVRAYFKLAQDTLRTAQEVTEWQMFAQQKQLIVQTIIKEVVTQLQKNPTILKPAVQQVMATSNR